MIYPIAGHRIHEEREDHNFEKACKVVKAIFSDGKYHKARIVQSIADDYGVDYFLLCEKCKLKDSMTYNTANRTTI